MTMNTVVQGAWALALAQTTGRDDVVFGATVSGRPAELAGVERMIGLFINTLPVRVRLDNAEPLTTLFQRIQNEQTQLLDHQWPGLTDIQSWAGHRRTLRHRHGVPELPGRRGCPRRPASGARLRARQAADSRTARTSSVNSSPPRCAAPTCPPRRLTGQISSTPMTHETSATGWCGCGRPWSQGASCPSDNWTHSMRSSVSGCWWSGTAPAVKCHRSRCTSWSRGRPHRPLMRRRWSARESR